MAERCEKEWDTEEEVQLFTDGHVDGLLGGETLSPEQIDQYLNAPIETMTLEIPLDLNSGDKEIVKKGLLLGLALATRGYWIAAEDVGMDVRVTH